MGIIIIKTHWALCSWMQQLTHTITTSNWPSYKLLHYSFSIHFIYRVINGFPTNIQIPIEKNERAHNAHHNSLNFVFIQISLKFSYPLSVCVCKCVCVCLYLLQFYIEIHFSRALLSHSYLYIFISSFIVRCCDHVFRRKKKSEMKTFICLNKKKTKIE